MKANKQFIKGRKFSLKKTLGTIVVVGGLLTSFLSGCAPVDARPGTYDVGEHKIVQIDRKWVWLWGKDGVQQVKAPEGYRVIGYDYSKSSDFEYTTILYTNSVAVETDNINSFGNPLVNISTDEDKIYAPGEYTVAIVERDWNLLFGQNSVKQIEVPAGYRILDADYNKADSTEYTIVLLTNTVPVKAENENEIAVPLEQGPQQEGDYYEAGTHYLLEIDRDFKWIYGKWGTQVLDDPEGYCTTSFGYGVTDSFQFTIRLYVNTEPVTVDNKDDFGVPLEDRLIK